MSILFEPTTIGNFEIRNRFIRSATYYALSDQDGFIGDESVALMSRLAASGIGLIITGYAFVAKHGQVFPDMNGIDTDEHILPLREMTKAVHDAGGKIVMQIAHGGSGAKTAAKNGRYLAVSPLDALVNKTNPPEIMTDEDIEQIIDAFGKAASRVREAGFDGVQIHGAHGYLVSEFLSPIRNRRSDRWGGSVENRARFLLEVTRSIKRGVDDDFPVMIKLGCRDYVSEGAGLTIEEGAEIAEMIADEGICHIEVSHGIMVGEQRKKLTGAADPEEEAFMLPDAKKVREKVQIPLALVGRMRSLALMEELVRSGACDQVSLCRPFIREPDLVAKFANGGSDKADCTSCGGCFNIDKSGKMRICCMQLTKR